MTHIDEQKLLEFNSSELECEELRRVETHLEECPSCRERLSHLQEDLALIEGSFPPEPHPVFWNNYLPLLKQRMEREKEYSAGYFTRWASALAGAAVALMLALMLLTGNINYTDFPFNYSLWTADMIYPEYSTITEDELDEFIIEEYLDPEAEELIPYDESDVTAILMEMPQEEVDKVFETIEERDII